mmetsp:Transcript_28554/g.59505  ORF Transcript_28554/g.59505 Transcript_28554/m.59505 type:complete len:285 (+) Transcript_28554:443-1297(+)
MLPATLRSSSSSSAPYLSWRSWSIRCARAANFLAFSSARLCFSDRRRTAAFWSSSLRCASKFFARVISAFRTWPKMDVFHRDCSAFKTETYTFFFQSSRSLFFAVTAIADFFLRMRCCRDIPVTTDVSSSTGSPRPTFLSSNMASSFLARASARCLRFRSASVTTLTGVLLFSSMAVSAATAFFLRRSRCRLDIPETADASSSSPAYLLSAMASIFLARASALTLRFFSSAVSTLATAGLTTGGSGLFTGGSDLTTGGSDNSDISSSEAALTSPPLFFLRAPLR